MEDDRKTNKQLADELTRIREQVEKLAGSEAGGGRAENMRKATKQSWGIMAESTPIIVAIIERDHIIGYVSHAEQDVSVEEGVGRKVYQFINPEYRERLRKTIEGVFKTGAPARCEVMGRGARRQGSLYATIILPIKRGTEVAEVALFATDVTERGLALAGLSWLAAILHSSQDAIIGKTTDGIITSWNPAAEKLYGYSAEEMLGKPISLLLPKDREDEVAGLIERVSRGEEVGTFETVRRRKDGRLVDVSVALSPIRNAEGRICGVSTIARDITERKRERERIARLKDVLRAIGDVTQAIIREKDRETMMRGVCKALNSAYPVVTIVVVDDEGRISGAWEAGLGDEFSVLQERLAAGSLPECLKNGLANPGVQVLDHRVTHADCPFPRAYRERPAVVVRLEHAGNVHGVLCTSFPSGIFSTEGEHALLREIASDVAFGLHSIRVEEEGKRAEEMLRSSEEQLRQSRRLEAIGRLAGGVAHDFNNLLMAMMGYCDLVAKDLKPDDPRSKDMAQAKVCGERAITLTRQLLAFSRKQTLQPRLLDLNEVVANLDKMLRRLIGEDIDLLTVPAPGLWRVKADPGQIEQVIVNLVVNARDAMPDGGKLTIETANVELEESYTKGHVGTARGPHVMLAVTDTGAGMDAETVGHIFEPFFTTKAAGRGTGLGLSTVYGIVKQSGGNIWCYSEPGKGTTFKIYLPREEAEPAPEVERDVTQARQGEGEHVVLVEDEAVVRRLLVRMIEGLNYEVTAAADGAEALLAVEKMGVKPDLLITDVILPGMSGVEMTERMRKTWPGLKVLYMSGYTDNAIVHQGVLDAGTPFIQKPFNAHDLAVKIREQLDSE